MDRLNQNTEHEQEVLAEARLIDVDYEGREQYEMDVARMINEGLGGGYITLQNGLVDEVE